MCLLDREPNTWLMRKRHPDASTTPGISTPKKYEDKLKPREEQNVYSTLELPPNSFSGGERCGEDTICRMLALQKEIGFGKGWEMTDLESGGLCVEPIPQLLRPTGAAWLGWHPYKQVYLAQQSVLKTSRVCFQLFVLCCHSPHGSRSVRNDAKSRVDFFIYQDFFFIIFVSVCIF